MNQRTKRELDFSIRLARLSARSKSEANTVLRRLPDDDRSLIITFRPLAFIAHRASLTQRRVFIERVFVGVYRVIDDKAAVFVSHTIDRAVVKAGHDPRSVDGRLFRHTVAKRLLFMATLFNGICTIVNPTALPLLGAYAILWPWYLWRADVERKSIMLQQGTS